MVFSFDIVGMQSLGDRKNQEDNYMISDVGDTSANLHEAPTIIAVADGMGGMAAGELASKLAVRGFLQHFDEHYAIDNIPQLLLDSLDEANQCIRSATVQVAARKGMGCTFIGIYLIANQMHWVSVGDSHIYLLRNGQIIKKNEDHSFGAYINEMQAHGKDVAASEINKNVLLSALDGGEIESIDCPDAPLILEWRDRILVATDGLDTLKTSTILQISSNHDTAQAYVEKLLDEVDSENCNNQDNTTIVVIDITQAEHEIPSLLIEPEKEKLTINFQRILTTVMLIVLLTCTAFVGSMFYDKMINTRITNTIVEDENITMDKPIENNADFISNDEVTVVQNVLQTSSAEENISLWTKIKNVFKKDKPDNALQTIDDEAKANIADTEIPPFMMKDNPKENAERVIKTAIKQNKTPKQETQKHFKHRLSVGGAGPLMITIPAATYGMGAPDSLPYFNERPHHKVNLKKFAVSVYEISMGQYNLFAKHTRHQRIKIAKWKRQHPVVNVSWHEAIAYTRWLSKQTKKRYYLPAEAQWEYFAKANVDTKFWWGNKIGVGNARCFSCDTVLDIGEPALPGQYKANPLGIFHTVGNVMEWVRDCYEDGYQKARSDGKVIDVKYCRAYSVRGSSYNRPPGRITKRLKYPADTRLDTLGFRIVLEY